MFKYELATSLTLNIEKYCYLNGLADLWCIRGRCLPIPNLLTNLLCLCSNSKKYYATKNKTQNLSAARRYPRFPMYDGVLAAFHVHVLHVISGVHRRVRLWFHDFRNCPPSGVLSGVVLPSGVLLLRLNK